jgi:hypothetical protein
VEFDRDFIQWFFVALAGLIILTLLVLAFVANWKRGLLFLGILGSFALIVVGAMFFPFILLCIIAGLLVIFSIGSIFFANRLDNLERSLRTVWNPRKAFSGAIFGDIANTLGVLAGMGASRVFSDQSWFWWVGQMGGLLAMSVGLSLLWRGTREKKNLFEQHNDIVHIPAADLAKVNRYKFFALFNFVVGFATWLSLMLITPGNQALVRQDPIRWFWFVFSFLLLLYMVPTFVTFIRNPDNFNAADVAILLTLVALVVTLIILSAVILFNIQSIPPGKTTIIAGVIASIIGICFWLAAEAYNWVVLTFQWNTDGVETFSALDYMVWEKNIWEVIGAVTTIVFLSAVLADAIHDRVSASGVQAMQGFEIVFIVGATLGFIGTSRGIISGILNRFQNGHP